MSNLNDRRESKIEEGRGDIKSLLIPPAKSEDNHDAFIPPAVQHGHEVLRDQLANEADKIAWHYVANTSLFEYEGEPTPHALWWFGQGYTPHEEIGKRSIINPVLADVNSAVANLTAYRGIWQPSKEAIEFAKNQIKSPFDMNSLKSVPEYLKLEGDGIYLGVLIPFDLNERSKLPNDVIRTSQLAWAGPDGNLDEVIRRYQIENKAVGKNPDAYFVLHTLHPQFILDNVRNGGALARVCRLMGFGQRSSFDAGGRFINESGAMRGVSCEMGNQYRLPLYYPPR